MTISVSDSLSEVADAIDLGDTTNLREHIAQLYRQENYTPNAQKIKELREKTGLSMQECKKALIKSCGDYDHALSILRGGVLA